MNPPSPALFFDTINAYQKSAALKAAIELDLFTAVGGDPATAAELAIRCNAAERGIRILADYLTINGFLEKSGLQYSLTNDSAVFLDRKSPAYCGCAVEFLHAREMVSCFDDLASAVRKGGTHTTKLGTIAPEHPVWESFARAMAPMMIPQAHGVAGLVPLPADRPARVLDVAAGHGMFGIIFAQKNPTAQLVALDWPNVLTVAEENARAAGLAGRFSTIKGDAFTVDLGSDYDVVLVPNFLHHFSDLDCTRFLRRVHEALRPGGRVVIVDFVPNDDRITPPQPASFALIMLGNTPEGDAYTFSEYEKMLNAAGFQTPVIHGLSPTPQSAIIAAK